MIFFWIFGIFLIIWGVLGLFAPDFMWELTHLGNLLEGEASERTTVWEVGRVIGGIIRIVGGLFLISITLH